MHLNEICLLQTLILAQVHGHLYKVVNTMRMSLLMQTEYSLQAVANSKADCALEVSSGFAAHFPGVVQGCDMK